MAAYSPTRPVSVLSLAVALLVASTPTPLDAADREHPQRVLTFQGHPLSDLRHLSIPNSLPAAAPPVRADERATDADWRHLRNFTPGAPITVRIDGGPDRRMAFISADEAEANLLATDLAGLTGEAERYLRMLLTLSPRFFTEVSNRSYLDQDSGIRVVAMEGMFVGERRLAAWTEMVISLPRTAFTERIVPERRWNSARRGH